MRKRVVCLLAILFLIPYLAACSDERVDGDKLQVVCTTFAQYDWVRELVRGTEAIEPVLLVDGGRDIHSYEPSAADLIALTEADLLIWGGGVSETFVGELIEAGRLKNTLCLMDELGDAVHHAEDHDHGNGALCGDADEHVWLSVKNAALLCKAIADALCRLDLTNEARYQSNLVSYLEQLSALDCSFAALASASKNPTVVVADRYPFCYLFDDYGITCYAAFPGCSSESDASFETVITLAEAVDANGLSGVLVIEGSDRRVAEAVIRNTKSGGEIYALDSMQTLRDPENASYLSIMQKNWEVLGEVVR